MKILMLNLILDLIIAIEGIWYIYFINQSINYINRMCFVSNMKHIHDNKKLNISILYIKISK